MQYFFDKVSVGENMKSIISINKKFMSYTPYELVKFVKINSKHIDGFEIYIDYKNKQELQYLQELSNICKKEKLYFQVHSDSSLTVEEQIEFIKVLENISDFLGYKINMVIHSVQALTSEESYRLTVDYITKISNTIDHSKIIISLENLNDIKDDDRLNIKDILPIIFNNENLFLTYDIGHDIVDYNNVTSLKQELIQYISNVHIHSTSYEIYSGGFDHKPIFKDDKNWNTIIKAILYLKHNGYDNSVVFEYDLLVCPGNTIEEKLISYCKSIDYVSERFKTS